jgi:ATP-dependent RNA helicase DeaD
MGRDGIAFTFVVPGEGEFLTNIEQRINKQLERDTIEGFEAVPPPPKPAQEEEPEVLGRKRLNPMNRKVKRRR